jgi:hypothetical protein
LARAFPNDQRLCSLSRRLAAASTRWRIDGGALVADTARSSIHLEERAMTQTAIAPSSDRAA